VRSLADLSPDLVNTYHGAYCRVDADSHGVLQVVYINVFISLRDLVSADTTCVMHNLSCF